MVCAAVLPALFIVIGTWVAPARKWTTAVLLAVCFATLMTIALTGAAVSDVLVWESTISNWICLALNVAGVCWALNHVHQKDGSLKALAKSSIAANGESPCPGTMAMEIERDEEDDEDDGILRKLHRQRARAQRDLELLEKPETIFAFGHMSYDGDGVPQDYAEAAGWFRIAAEQGHAKAAHNLGLMCEEGKGTPQDFTEAAKWYRKAAELWDAGSQNNLGVLCEKGAGVPKDEAEALSWYKQAAANGDASAAANAERLQRKVTRDECNALIGDFVDSLSTKGPPLIGDCETLPHPKQKLLYALRWMIDYYETVLGTTGDDRLRSKCQSLVPTLGGLFTGLARDWHEIDAEDKDAIARLNQHESFPEWASPLKQKYINEDKAREEACDAALQVTVDRVERAVAARKEAGEAEVEVALQEFMSKWNRGSPPDSAL